MKITCGYLAIDDIILKVLDEAMCEMCADDISKKCGIGALTIRDHLRGLVSGGFVGRSMTRIGRKKMYSTCAILPSGEKYKLIAKAMPLREWVPHKTISERSGLTVADVDKRMIRLKKYGVVAFKHEKRRPTWMLLRKVGIC